MNSKECEIKTIIDDFCKIVLTTKDYIDEDETDNFIMSLTDKLEIVHSIKNPEIDRSIRSNILNNLMNYISGYQSIQNSNRNKGVLFGFDHGLTYTQYIEDFSSKYTNVHDRLLAPIFKFTFSYIQEVSEHYRIFLGFYDTRSEETSTIILNKSEKIAREAVQVGVMHAATEAATQAATEATQAATTAANKAKKAALQAKKIADDAKDNTLVAQLEAKNAAENAKKATIEVANEIETRLTAKTSETSVTILGIFAGIVLSVVAGLFYSSSVLNNINSASTHKLVIVSSVVGYVCFNIISLMFNYIERFRGKIDAMQQLEATKNEVSVPRAVQVRTWIIQFAKKLFSSFSFWVNLALLLIIFTTILGYKEPVNDNYSDNSNINVNVNVSKSENVSVSEGEYTVAPSTTESSAEQCTSKVPSTESNKPITPIE